MSIKKIFKLFINVPLLLIPFVLRAGDTVTLTAVGDMRFDRYIAGKIQEHGMDYPFKRVLAFLKDADITYGNLECPLASSGEPIQEKQYVFRSDPAMVGALQSAGFDIVDLANNHSGDYGKDALLETMAVLSDHDILYCGAGNDISSAREPRIIERDGIRFAFISFSNTFPDTFWATKEQPGVTPAYLSFIKEDVAAARKKADHVIVAYHGGDERSDTPKESQKKIAHTAISAGASLVLGHHPHVLQGIEVYKTKPIIYSLGNFLFLSTAQDCYDTMMVQISFTKEKVVSIDIVPSRIGNAFVRKAGPQETKRILDKLQNLSKQLGTDIRIKGTSAQVIFE